MRHDQRGASGEFDGKVAIRNCVQRVLAYAVKAQQFSHHFAPDRIAGAGQGCRAKWQAIHAFAAIVQAFHIAFEHLEIRHQMMRKTDRLRDLQVGETGHDGAGMVLGEIKQRSLQRLDEM